MMATPSSLMYTAFLLLFVLSVHAVRITTPPQNTVAMSGSVVQLTCGVSEAYTGYFQWRVYMSGEIGGEQVYYSPPFTPSSPRFREFDKFGLEINPVGRQDAGKYSCNFLTGDVRATANIVVLDEPVVYSNPAALIVGQSANLSCALSFGGPKGMDATSPPDTQGMFPQLTLSLGPDRPLDLSSASLRHDPGEPGSSRHQLTVVKSYEVSMDDVGRSLICTVSTADPVFSTEATTQLTVFAPAQDVSVEPSRNEYSVGNVINCSANGWPAPSLAWRHVSGPMAAGASDGRVLNVVEAMRDGLNVWKCIAMNNFGNAELVISFNVSLAPPIDDEPSDFSEGVSGTTIGLAVGVPITIIVILAVIGAILFLYCFKKKGLGMKDGEQRNPFVRKSNLTAEPSSRPNGGKPPIYRGQMSTDEPPLDRSGYGDLGLGLVRQASHEALDVNTEGDMRRPRQEPATNRAEGPFSDGWRDPNARHYANVPVHSVEGDSDLPPVSAMGFADIGGGLHGSRQSLNRVSDATGGPVRGSNPSVNRSHDSSTGPAAANPRTRGRDAAVARGSNPNLDRSTDSSEPAMRRPAGTAGPRPADQSKPPAHPPPPATKPRPAIKPPMPPKKPDLKVAADEDDGTEV